MKHLRSMAEDRPDISYLQPRLDFEEVLEGLGIDIAFQRGTQIMCHCPNGYNHKNGDANPSFGFDTKEMIYNCFVCGGGWLLDLVNDQLGLADDESERWLQQMSTMEPQTSDALKEKLSKLMNKSEIKTIIPNYPVAMLDKYLEDDAFEHVKSRGISAEVVKEMMLGFDRHDHGGIIIPHFWKGNLVGWQVRHVLKEDDTYFCNVCKLTVAKYVSTPCMPKSTTLYNYDRCIGSDSVIVVESPMTVLYLMSHGYRNAVATFGSWSAEQMNLLTVFPRVYLWADNDPAGKNNISRVVTDLRYLTDVRIVPVVDLPNGDGADVDPEGIDEYINKSFSPVLVPFYGTPLVTLANMNR